MKLVTKIISGGQTGADRGALDAAIDLGLQRGGWAPRGWRSKDGTIPERYRVGMLEHGSRYYRDRTRQNVLDADATLVLSLGRLRPNSGSALTVKIARRFGKPYACLTVDMTTEIRDWLRGTAEIRAGLLTRNRGIRILNVAGPRESREPGIQRAVRDALVRILADTERRL